MRIEPPAGLRQPDATAKLDVPGHGLRLPAGRVDLAGVTECTATDKSRFHLCVWRPWRPRTRRPTAEPTRPRPAKPREKDRRPASTISIEARAVQAVGDEVGHPHRRHREDRGRRQSHRPASPSVRRRRIRDRPGRFEEPSRHSWHTRRGLETGHASWSRGQAGQAGLKYFRFARRQAVTKNAVRGMAKTMPRIPPSAVPQKKMPKMIATG